MSGKHHITMKERIERRVYFSIDGCWLWTGKKRKDIDGGYGLIKIDGRITRAHRVSYKTYKGPIPKGLFVCHTCDVPLCVNPNHLFVGTLQENNYDMYKKGRNARFFGNAFLYVREWFDNPINRGLFASFLVGLVIFWILLDAFCFIVTR